MSGCLLRSVDDDLHKILLNRHGLVITWTGFRVKSGARVLVANLILMPVCVQAFVHPFSTLPTLEYVMQAFLGPNLIMAVRLWIVLLK